MSSSRFSRARPHARMYACTHARTRPTPPPPPVPAASLRGSSSYKVFRSVDLQVLRDVADGLLFLHTRRPPIVHADVKSPNVLLDETGASRHVLRGLGHVRPGARQGSAGLSTVLRIRGGLAPVRCISSAACGQPLGAWGTSPVVCCTLHVARCPRAGRAKICDFGLALCRSETAGASSSTEARFLPPGFHFSHRFPAVFVPFRELFVPVKSIIHTRKSLIRIR
jgi:serine/threonine protein kinase